MNYLRPPRSCPFENLAMIALLALSFVAIGLNIRTGGEMVKQLGNHAIPNRPTLTTTNSPSVSPAGSKLVQD